MRQPRGIQEKRTRASERGRARAGARSRARGRKRGQGSRAGARGEVAGRGEVEGERERARRARRRKQERDGKSCLFFKVFHSTNILQHFSFDMFCHVVLFRYCSPFFGISCYFLKKGCQNAKNLKCLQIFAKNFQIFAKNLRFVLGCAKKNIFRKT